MKNPPVNVHRTLTFGTGQKDMLGLAGGLGVFLFALYVHQTQRFDYKSWVFMAFGLAIAGWALTRIINPKSRLVLSERGAFFRVPGPWKKGVFVPWREVVAIDTLNIPAGKGEFSDVTVLTIPKAYYDRHIHTDSLVARVLPDWDAHFRLVGDKVQVALHHWEISVPAERLRAEVDARWRAFGPAAAKAAAEG